jgi:hypothetical protein
LHIRCREPAAITSPTRQILPGTSEQISSEILIHHHQKESDISRQGG